MDDVNGNMREILLDMSTAEEEELSWLGVIAMAIGTSRDGISHLWRLQYGNEKSMCDMEQINAAYHEMYDKMDEFESLVKTRIMEIIAINVDKK